MRTYLSEENLQRAWRLSAVVTLMSIPRLLVWPTDVSLTLRIGVTFVSMTLIAGAATAWQREAGLAGLFPRGPRVIAGLRLAAVAALLCLPVAVWLDPVKQQTIASSGDAAVLELAYPTSIGAAIGLLLWGCGFELVFFTAAGLAFFARLTRSLSTAIGLCAVLRLYVALQKVVDLGAMDILGAVCLEAVVGTVVICLVFARAGLPGAALFHAILDGRHLVYAAVQ